LRAAAVLCGAAGTRALRAVSADLIRLRACRRAGPRAPGTADHVFRAASDLRGDCGVPDPAVFDRARAALHRIPRDDAAALLPGPARSIARDRSHGECATQPASVLLRTLGRDRVAVRAED